jgi:hypothetical protein
MSDYVLLTSNEATFHVISISLLFKQCRTFTCSHINTYSMEQSPSWEADQFSQLTKKFPAFYGT